jgi:hypothetical protein
MYRVTFFNPADSSSYVWPVNPDFTAEAVAQKQITIERTSNTNSVGATRQQGDDGPYLIHWDHLVYHNAHELAMWEWKKLSKKQTIYLTDFNNEQFEGQIVTLGSQRIGVIGATGGLGETNARGFYWKFVFEFEVWRALTGPLETAGVEM